jgi:phosphoserine phosphatase RsbX
MSEAELAALLDVGTAGRALDALAEGNVSGDVAVAVPFSGGALVAVIDGLGHGVEAAAAAHAAAGVLESRAGETVLQLIRECHERLHKTRGAVMSLACFSAKDSSMTWTGIGNVEGILFRRNPTARAPRENLVARGGVIGYQLPTPRAVTLPVSRGDTLIFATDGIRSGFSTGLALEHSPRELADSILARHARETDDALVLVARYLRDAR